MHIHHQSFVVIVICAWGASVCETSTLSANRPFSPFGLLDLKANWPEDEADTSWTHYARNATCSAGDSVELQAANETACADAADVVSSGYFSFHANDSKCRISPRCTIENEANWTTMTKVLIKWGLIAINARCDGPTWVVVNETFCARHAAKSGHMYYSYDGSARMCSTTATCSKETRIGDEHFQIKVRGGAPWTDREMNAIRATMFEIFDWDWKRHLQELCVYYRGKAYPCFLERFEPPEHSARFETCDSENKTSRIWRHSTTCSDGNGSTVSIFMPSGAIPTAPKFLRLGFHDCFRYKDGGRGCDGCLNFRGMFVMKNIGEESSSDTKLRAGMSYDIVEGDNNNLAGTADLLERIYTDHTFGAQSSFLTTSLKDSGKSRADLWAYVALLAAEFFMLRNNDRCDTDQPRHLYNYLPNSTLHHSCKINRTRPFIFHSGRRDCSEDWKPATRHNEYQMYREEVQANPHMSGKQVAQWFDENFNFTPRETVAIMGAHNAGALDSRTSTFRYTWSGYELHQDLALNNLFYRSLAFKPVYLQADLWLVAKAMHEGVAPPPPRNIKWKLDARHLTPSKGPVQWFMKTFPVEGSGLDEQTGGMLHATMLNTDMGLFLDFDITTSEEGGGFPIRNSTPGHCSKLATVASNLRPTLDAVDAQTCLQKAGSTGRALHQIVEEYADNQDLWWHDFTEALEKLLTNGYNRSILVPHEMIATALIQTP